MMRVWRLSVAYIGPKLRTKTPRKTKIGTEVAHVTHDSDTTFKIKRSTVNLQGLGHILAASHTVCFLLCAIVFVYSSGFKENISWKQLTMFSLSVRLIEDVVFFYRIQTFCGLFSFLISILYAFIQRWLRRCHTDAERVMSERGGRGS